jgi:hypothetical protein
MGYTSGKIVALAARGLSVECESRDTATENDNGTRERVPS